MRVPGQHIERPLHGAWRDANSEWMLQVCERETKPAKDRAVNSSPDAHPRREHAPNRTSRAATVQFLC